MTTINRFASPQGWRITSWGVDKEGPIPDNGFVAGGCLVIGIVANGTQSCTLSWLNGINKASFITDLHFNENTERLHRQDAVVSFGGIDVDCQVTICLDRDSDTFIRGTLKIVKNTDGNTGTFAAEAIPPPVEPG
jgi:hypothetical protein